MGFAELSDRAQVHRLRAAALVALEEYPVRVERLRLLNHDYNTTFRLDAAEGTYAIRINTNRRKPVGALDAEMAWLAALAEDTDVVVPVPLATVAGGMHSMVEVADIDEPLHMVVMSWLPGRDLDVPTIPATRELGRQMAMLHEHAFSWAIPDHAEFPRIDSVFMDSEDLLRSAHPAVSPERQALFAEALDSIEPLFDAMLANEALFPIHADLHPWNVKWLRGRMAVFDFDDGGIGGPAQDIAIANFYLPEEPAIRSALLAGYAEVRELPVYTDDQMHTALTARTLVLANDLLGTESGESRDLRDRYLGIVEARVRAYLDSGTYQHNVPGVVPLH